MKEKKTIVVSAVNLVEAGTLAILRDCLSFLSTFVEGSEYRVVAIVHKKALVDFPNITYIETQWPKKRWINRLWYEYVTMKRISKTLAPVYLWFSLHDTSPSVVAQRRAVYCHNAFSFYKWKLHDLLFAPKIVLFALFTKYIYKPNIRKNNYIVVQQAWFRSAMSKMFGISAHRIIVARPSRAGRIETQESSVLPLVCTFIFAASPNSHKNFEVICRAAELLEKNHIHSFRVLLTVKGNENAYARWLYKQWGHLSAVEFIGFLSKQALADKYEQSHCMIFPSKVETWGLPISEFAQYGKPMLLADLPYAQETSSGAPEVAFFHPDQPEVLADMMAKLIEGDREFLQSVPQHVIEEPFADDWTEIFAQLLK